MTEVVNAALLPAEALAADLKARLTAAKAELEKLEEQRGARALAGTQSLEGASAFQAHLERIAAVQSEATMLDSALVEAERQAEDQRAERLRKHERHRIEKAKALLAKRDEAGDRVQALVGQLASAWRDLLAAAEKVQGPDAGLLTNKHGFLLTGGELCDALANELWRASAADISAYITGNPGSRPPPPSLPGSHAMLRTGSPTPYRPDTAPALADRLREASAFAGQILDGRRRYDGKDVQQAPALQIDGIVWRPAHPVVGEDDDGRHVYGPKATEKTWVRAPFDLRDNETPLAAWQRHHRDTLDEIDALERDLRDMGIAESKDTKELKAEAVREIKTTMREIETAIAVKREWAERVAVCLSEHGVQLSAQKPAALKATPKPPPTPSPVPAPAQPPTPRPMAIAGESAVAAEIRWALEREASDKSIDLAAAEEAALRDYEQAAKVDVHTAAALSSPGVIDLATGEIRSRRGPSGVPVTAETLAQREGRLP